MIVTYRQESLSSFDYVLALPLSIHDTSAVQYNKAETLFIMARLQEAVALQVSSDIERFSYRILL